MRRPLSGSLEHLAATDLLRLVSATSPNGVLEIDTPEGSLRIEMEKGRVKAPTKSDLERAGKILGSRDGEFRFTPRRVEKLVGDMVNLTTYVEAAGAASTDFEVELLLEEEPADAMAVSQASPVHDLPYRAPQNPLDDLVLDLEAEAPEEMLFTEIGVLTPNPRWWWGNLELDWRRQGWRLQPLTGSDDENLDGLDLVVVHHQRTGAEIGLDQQLLSVVRRVSKIDPPVPVVYVGPLEDQAWIQELIDAGASFLLPAPTGDTKDAASNFAESLSLVVDRQLRLRQQERDPGLPPGVSELVETLLSDSGPEHGVSALLQLAAPYFSRVAILIAEEQSIRKRAGFGYRLRKSKSDLPRGVSLVEGVIRSGRALTEIEPGGIGAGQLARALGVPELFPRTAIIPLGREGAVVGVLVADRG
ncbi:MAG: DUF4388 domain-containing protein, partial [Acidobacteriota bacterium]